MFGTPPYIHSFTIVPTPLPGPQPSVTVTVKTDPFSSTSFVLPVSLVPSFEAALSAAVAAIPA
jgi:hypothetical protein